MARDQIICGLDIGTTKIRSIVVQKRRGADKLTVVGVGETQSFGVKRGMVTDIDEVVESINKAVSEAENTSGKQVDSVVVNLSGPHMSSKSSKGVVAVSRADQEISKEDKLRVLKTTEAISLPTNRKIIHVLPKEFIIDGEGGIKNPLGMNGVRLEVNALLIDFSLSVINNTKRSVESAGLDVDDMLVSTIASSSAVLSKRQKELGVLVLDMGGGTSGVSIYEDGSLVHTAIIPVGSSHITNDIAIGLRTEIDIAEKVKLEYGVADISKVNKKETIDLKKMGFEGGGTVSKKYIAEIIQARLDEIFDLVEKELKKVSKQGLLPGGVILVGGGSNMPYIVEFTRNKLKLPVQLGVPGTDQLDGIVDIVSKPEYATLVGLVMWSLSDESDDSDFAIGKSSSSVGVSGKLKKFFKLFMP